jgi:DNA-binding transcriptional regulator YhcF (GntR family)
MRDRIDHQSPVPLYHQVAEAVRYRIATGELQPGRRLPSLRQAAELWGVNLHTVRRAYAELAEQGVLASRSRSGTVVLNGGAARVQEANDLDAFLRQVLRQGSERWGLSPSELTLALAEKAVPAVGRSGPVYVVECSETQARDLAAQVERRWRVRAEPWSLEWDGEPGDGVVLATFFHHSDVRRRWPERFPSVRFAAIEPDPALRQRLDAAAGGAERIEVVLCERTEAMARNIAADLKAILPAERYRVRLEVGPPAEVLAQERVPVLLPPRVWAQVPPAARRGHAHLVRYVFAPATLERLGVSLEWKSR